MQILAIKALIALTLVFAVYQVLNYLMEVGGYSWKKFYQDICHTCRRVFGPLKIEGPAEQPTAVARRH